MTEPDPLPKLPPKKSLREVWDSAIEMLMPWLVRLVVALIGLGLAWIGVKVDQISRQQAEQKQAATQAVETAKATAVKADEAKLIGAKTLVELTGDPKDVANVTKAKADLANSKAATQESP